MGRVEISEGRFLALEGWALMGSMLDTYHSIQAEAEQVLQFLISNLEVFVPHLSNDEVDSLYWEWLEIPVAAIAGALGIEEQVCRARISNRLEIAPEACPICSQEVSALVKSRTERDNVQRMWRKYSYVCDVCRGERNRVDSLYWEQKLAEREKRLEELRAMPYKDYLRTSEWYATRDKARLRAGYTCELCNSPEELNVHHRTYIRLGKEEPRDLIVLCWICHSEFHDRVGLHK